MNSKEVCDEFHCLLSYKDTYALKFNNGLDERVASIFRIELYARQNDKIRQAKCSGNLSSIPNISKKLFSPPQLPDTSWAPLASY